MVRQVFYTLLFVCFHFYGRSQSFFTVGNESGSFALSEAVILVDDKEEALVKRSAELLQQDICAVTGKKPAIVFSAPKEARGIILIGTLRSAYVVKLESKGKLKSSGVRDQWEAYRIQSIQNFDGNIPALVIMGSDRRGAAFGVFEFSKQMGVSPWYWWADVPVAANPGLRVAGNINSTDAPKVKYRGIFINDEAPALSNWNREKFGGFNHKFYEKVFELMLRLKSNYIWPAMWGNAFYYDDSLNIKMADQYGIVIGTSHHEPMMRAHEEWKYYGKGRKWNYDSTEAGLKEYWRGGFERAWNEKIVSLGMRGDGDEPMSRETATALLERIVKDQRTIIERVSGKPAEATPQLWALYKEVQDYYDKGMRVPDDVTLLLCDDNWGNIRKLPRFEEKPRKGGYGIYYHFDYVGGPRNYKWVNTNPLPRIWEQMHMAWQYNARQIWIVNVGDIKPMEFPISFFLDYAWNPEQIGADDLQRYTEEWAAAQFGNKHAKEIAPIISSYGKYNGRRKPELLDANTYHLFNYNEAQRVKDDYNQLLVKAKLINEALPQEYRDAFFQLVLHPVKACANLHDLYTAVGFNRYYAAKKSSLANHSANIAKNFYENDSLITLEYHQLNKGKWNHMMRQTHIGYTYWQQPEKQKMPEVKYVAADSILPEESVVESADISAIGSIPANSKGNIFYELNGYVSIEADHYTNAFNTNGINWKILPDHGRTGSAVAPFPVTASEQKPGGNAPHIEYEFYTYSKDSIKIHSYFSPSLNYHNTEQGLQYAISIDDEEPQIISINAEDKNTGRGIWNKWVAENIIIQVSSHLLSKPGKHTIKYWMVNPGVVLQKIVGDTGGLKPSYLGPPETRYK